MNEYQAIQFLPILMQMDKRLFFHTISEINDDEWEHVEMKCPLCQANWLLDKYGINL